MKKYGKSNIPKKKSQKIDYSKRRARIKYYSTRFTSGKDIFTKMLEASEQEFNAEVIRQKAREAERLELEMSAQGFVLPENIHNLIQEQKDRPNGATQKTLERLTMQFDRRRLMAFATYRTDTYYKNGEAGNLSGEYDTGLRYIDFQGQSPAALGKKLNSVLRSGKDLTNTFSYDLSTKIYLLVNNEKDLDKLYKKGTPYEDDEIKIDPSWDGTPETLGQHITFKKFKLDNEISKDYLLDVMNNPYSNKGLHEAYLESVNDTTYYKFAEDMGWDMETADQLSFLMNTSHAWAIAYQYANEDSKRAKSYWENLGNKISSLSHEGLLPIDWYNDIYTSIINEEDYNVIIKMIDQAIATAHKYRD